MDPQSEVELKFGANRLTVKDFKHFMVDIGSYLPGVTVDSFKVIGGIDYYWDVSGAIVRYRSDDAQNRELTYKKRKSCDSIADRVEINLGLTVKDDRSVSKFLEGIGGKFEFLITKKSYIYYVKTPSYHATVALYDVSFKENCYPDRYLEVEIEASSPCTTKTALKELNNWKELLTESFVIEGPLNSSLFEIYKGT